MSEQIQSSSKKVGRGMAKESVALIQAMYEAAKKAHPITGRGIGYKLFVAKLIPSRRTSRRDKPPGWQSSL
jgi:hypothetical protein